MRRAPSARPAAIAVAGAVTTIATIAALAFPAPALAAGRTVSGTVYDDYAELGVQNSNPAAGQLDNGIPGVEIVAYNASNRVVGRARSDSAGDYRLTGLPSGQIRVEIEVPSGYQVSEDATSSGGTVAGAHPNTTSTLGSNERYLNDSGSPSGIDFGLERPYEYAPTHPAIAYGLQWAGTPTGDTSPAIVTLPYLATATQAGTTLATDEQIGTTLGIAVDPSNYDVFAGAYYKDNYGLLPAGTYPGLTYPTGAIYLVNPATHAVKLFADVDAGPFDDPTSGNDAQTWQPAGHEGWGALAIDPTGQNLYAVSLYNHSLYRFPLSGGSVNSTGQVEPASITPITNPGCAGSGDWAPWSLSFSPLTGALYVGGVCTAASTQHQSDLHAYVELVHNPAGSPSFSTAFQFGLGYNRLDNDSKKYPSGSKYSTGDQAQANSDWEPWPTTSSVPPGTYPGGPSDYNRGTRTTPFGQVDVDDESYPALSGITFDAQGNMVLDFRDLMSDVTDFGSPGANQSFPTPQGDLLKACATDGGWSLESKGSCGGAPGFLPTVNGAAVSGATHGIDDAVFGPIGPGGGHFFDPNDVDNESQSDTPALLIAPYTGRDAVPDPQLGGVLSIPGFSGIVNTQDSAGAQNAYGVPDLVWDNDLTGDFAHYTSEVPGKDYVAKSNGLGDLAAFAGEAPVEIGNRVWRDTHRDCTEVAGDPGIGGVQVNLLSAGGADLATATTGAAGQYTFSILHGTPYKLQIRMNQAALHGLVPTCARKRGVDPRITSKGTLSGGRDVASVAALGQGQNDFNYDFGFVKRHVVRHVVRHRHPRRRHRHHPPRFTG